MNRNNNKFTYIHFIAIFLLKNVNCLIIPMYFYRMLKMYAKNEDMITLLRKFTTNEWKFDNSNTKKLWSSLCQEDHQTFWFSMDKFDWDSYSKCFYYGIREHILHEDLRNNTEALARNRKYDLTIHNKLMDRLPE